jgi:hypothetical protein
MNKLEIIAKLAENGIHQLRKGESVQDALDSVENGTPRIGYDFKHRDGRLMTENEIKSASWKEAFSKTVRTPEYVGGSDEINIEDIPAVDDFRDDMSKVGEIQECQYCYKPVRTDEGAHFEIINCEDCMSYAIHQNCM